MLNKSELFLNEYGTTRLVNNGTESVWKQKNTNVIEDSPLAKRVNKT